MKKQLIVVGMTMLLFILLLSGCFENSNEDKENGESPEVKLFLGKWRTTIYYYDQNETRYDSNSSNSTFYNNGTMGSESVEDDKIIWTPYVIDNNQICLGEVNALDYLCYNYEFSNTGNEATLMAYYQDPNYGDTYRIVIEMIKT